MNKVMVGKPFLFETYHTVPYVEQLAHENREIKSIGASIASGSFKTPSRFSSA
jgi:3-polyprenyl-4-hydroxybenzoate decarboxylase